MITVLSVRFRKYIAWFLYVVFYADMVTAAEVWKLNAMPYYPPLKSTSAGAIAPVEYTTTTNAIERGRKKMAVSSGSSAFGGGPTQPEMQAFQSVNANNMVDLFTGDFSYNIPLLDVGGYPVNISYHSGISMDEDASWVGLGWNINPGSITRNMRGLPDDFNGGNDTVRKVAHIKDNKTFGATVGFDVEKIGRPLGFGGSLGLFHSTYTGWGIEIAANASLNAGQKAHGPFSGKLSLSDNSQTGITIDPSLSFKMSTEDNKDNGSFGMGVKLGLPYNSRTGIKALQLGLNDKQTFKSHPTVQSSPWNTELSFAGPTYTPTMSLPLTNYNFSFTVKFGFEHEGTHTNLFMSAYGGKEYVASGDTSLSLPAFGYLNYQNINGNWSALTDFNREKELPYREKPAIPHIAVPAYTYDVFTISGEGTGGMFRAYRGDIGFIADHQMQSKTISGAGSIDLGTGGGVHGGTDLNVNYSTTKTGPWLQNNTLGNKIGFQKSDKLFEASYFRNPGEKTINTTAFYNAIGGDDVVAPTLFQSGNSDPNITTGNRLYRYDKGKQKGVITVDPTTRKDTRDKRSEVISYLTASEAAISGLDKHIVRYAVNKFGLQCCSVSIPEDTMGKGTGLLGYYYANRGLKGLPVTLPRVNGQPTPLPRLDRIVYFDWNTGSPYWSDAHGHQDLTLMKGNDFSVRWLGRIKPPLTGCYNFATKTDDGVRLWINDTLLIDDWTIHPEKWNTHKVNMVGGKLYNIRMEYFEASDHAVSFLCWKKPGDNSTSFTPQQDSIAGEYLYPPNFADTVELDSIRTQEDRVNDFRRSNHISEIDVLNPDGRRYVYGIPVYNLKQKEVSFSADFRQADVTTGLTGYTDGIDNSVLNTQGKDGYFSKQEIPAYAHSFLLTGVLSPDYVDVTGDGISDDDIGDAVKFNYSKTAGIGNPFEWRAPYVTGKANYDEGFRSYLRDDKGHYIYGNKELWYLHSIESKTMVANFILQPRADLLEANEYGGKTTNNKAMCLKQIELYSKVDYMQHGAAAKPVKTVHFEYSYELCRGINSPINDSGKLTLKRIWFSYNGNEKGAKNPYVFNYDANNPGYRVNAADKWGLYKDPAQNPGTTSTNVITNAEYPYALQDSVAAAYNAGAWTLDSIGLPSGGRIKVKYESDDYAFVQNRRATLMCKIAGLGKDTLGHYDNHLYGGGLGKGDNMFVYIKVPFAVSGNDDLLSRYLEGIGKFYFRINVRMPTDDFGSGFEYVPTYVEPDIAYGHWFGVSSSSVIWIKVKGVNSAGDGDGPLSPLAQTAINFLRLNLPSKAYPGSELNEDLNIPDVIKSIVALGGNIFEMLNGFSNTARIYGWCSNIDTSRSFVRLDCPTMKKYGGGLRVKSVLIYDNWKNMTGGAKGKKETVYGQTYSYTTTRLVNGAPITISSGVASWEPAVGGEENPFHLPIEYLDKIAPLAPAAAQYTEEPLGETFFPGASIGYSKVRVRTIHAAGTRSANGFSETSFYTSYDFPTSWDWSLLDNDTKKRYKPLLQNFLRINAVNYLTMSQGFKVELNDMNGKLRSEATYAETDSANLISYTENFYKVDNQSVEFKHLDNRVTTIDPQGNIDTTATIGKDAELMADMREQTSTSIGANINVNVDLFFAGAWPVILPSLLNLYQQERNQFRSAATMKVIQRYGILDSVVHIDKGSMVSSKNLLYDAETGDPLLVRTSNEFDDSLFQFTYPAHWVYKAAGPAYQNIDATIYNATITKGEVTGLTAPVSTYLSAGDELLVYSKESVTQACNSDSSYSSFADAYKLWVIDTNAVHGTASVLRLVDKHGLPFSGYDVTIKVTRSGHRNLGSAVGAISSLGNPLQKDGSGMYHLVIDSTIGILNAAASEMQQYWKVADKRTSDINTSCVYTAQDSAEAAAEGCSCLKPFFDYLISHHLLFIKKWSKITVRSLVQQAAAAGYPVSLGACPLLNANADGLFYTTSSPFMTVAPTYGAMIGKVRVDIRSKRGGYLNFYNLASTGCDAFGRVSYKIPGALPPKPDTVTTKLYPSFSVNLLSMMGSACPGGTDSLLTVDSTSDHLMVENSLTVGGIERNAVSILRWDQLDRKIPFWASILSARMVLQADLRGHIPGTYNNANSQHPNDSTGYSLSAPAGWFPYQPLDTMLYQAYYSPWFKAMGNRTAFQNDTLDVKDYLNGVLSGIYPSGTFILTQGSGLLHDSTYDSSLIVKQVPPDLTHDSSYDPTPVIKYLVPPYLTSGYGDYYSTFYSQRYADSTKWPVIQLTYTSPAPDYDSIVAYLQFNATINCTTVNTRSCYSSITDTPVNPYQYGILGSLRPQKSYVYYGRRKESDPSQLTNIRRNGTISGFAPFWQLQSGGWVPVYDTTRWVWNSQVNLYNRKGFELENADPLGRYNSGLYGYGLTLPTAVIQNGRYQEVAFEGFEDYGYTPNTCDTLCPESRPFDFSAYKGSISDSMAHTGLYSLRINKNGAVGLSTIVASSPAPAAPDLNMMNTGGHFAGARASSATIIPSFSPLAGRKMLVSAWVKEQNVCTCKSYTRDHVLIGFSDGSSVTLQPSGNMIEGWQRIESVVIIPSGATGMTLTLQASDSSTTYFDDIRILPYNGEMKSYVYNPINLRLMAELDENNYATFYEYDDDGTLIRVKKETERGIQTIKETHSALLKN